VKVCLWILTRPSRNILPTCEYLANGKRSNITSLLSQLPALFSQIKNPEPALLPTLNAALAALEKTGGKIICSLSALPTWGPGRLFLRDDGKQHGGDAEKKLLDTEHPGWRKAADKMVQAGVGVDFFLAAPGGGYLDIATIGKFSIGADRLNLTYFRSCFSIHWRRNFLLPQFRLATGHRETVPRDNTHRHTRDWISSADESPMFERFASTIIPRQFHSPYFWR
jgi:hypothetical protein